MNITLTKETLSILKQLSKRMGLSTVEIVDSLVRDAGKEMIKDILLTKYIEGEIKNAI